MIDEWEHELSPINDPAWIICPSCDEIVPRNEADEHYCPIEGLEDE